MKRLSQAVILTRLARKLRDKGSWCGETHVQKAVYLLQELLNGPTQFDFVLYKHGPFSFDLRDELTSLRADGLLELEFQPIPYGPRLAPTDRAQTFERVFTKTVTRQEPKLDFVARHCGDKGVMELEKLATALYVTRHHKGGAAVSTRAKRLHALKPHIPLDQATASVQEIDRVLTEAKDLAAT